MAATFFQAKRVEMCLAGVNVTPVNGTSTIWRIMAIVKSREKRQNFGFTVERKRYVYVLQNAF